MIICLVLQQDEERDLSYVSQELAEKGYWFTTAFKNIYWTSYKLFILIFEKYIIYNAKRFGHL